MRSNIRKRTAPVPKPTAKTPGLCPNRRRPKCFALGTRSFCKLWATAFWTPITNAARRFVGLTREDARKAVVGWFKDHDLLEEVKPYRHSVGHSYRSHVPVEPYLSDQWYVAVQKPIPWMPDSGPVEGTTVPQNSLAGLALTALAEPRRVGFSPPSAEPDAAADGGADGGLKPTLRAPRASDAAFRFVPDRYAKTFHDWNAGLRDWCISRQLWWGHRIPVWTRTYANSTAFHGGPSSPEDGFSDTVSILHSEGAIEARSIIHRDETRTMKLGWSSDSEFDLFLAMPADSVLDILERPVAIRSDAEAMGFQQDPDVLDTWFSSALWPMSTLGWPDRTPSLEEWNPTSVLCTAREIITLWVSRMVMFNRYLLAHPDEGREAKAVAERAGSAANAGDSRTLGEHSGDISEHANETLTHSNESSEYSDETSEHSDKASEYSDESSEYSAGSDESAGASRRSALIAGPVPFREVFIHAMIQDGYGQKMSKSLGNGVDPLDIIASHGADAMRFTLCGMTTHTQDVRLPVDVLDPHTGEAFAAETFVNSSGYTVFKPVQTHQGKRSVSSYGLASGEATPTADTPAARNTSNKFDAGRNFCNKLWNAGRFVISNLRDTHPERGQESPAGNAQDSKGVSGATPDPFPGSWSVVDRWILSRLARTVEAANKALDEYRFDRYATACYDFFWRDFCDWYVEAAKPVMKEGGAAAKQTAQVLATCLDVSLRLMHPMIPFATERLWWALNEAMPTRGIPGRFDCPPSERCIKAAWPSSSATVDDEAEGIVARLQEIATAIRTIRTENKVDPRKTVPVTIRGEVADVATLELWTTSTITAAPDAVEPENAAKTSAAGCDLFEAGVVDPAAEAGRMAKERTDLEKKVATLQGRLANKGYTDKAPPHLVQQTRDELAAALLALDQS